MCCAECGGGGGDRGDMYGGGRSPCRALESRATARVSWIGEGCGGGSRYILKGVRERETFGGTGK